MNILITGAGKGIGYDLAQQLSTNHQVIGISRNIDALKNQQNIHPLVLDLLEENQYHQIKTALIQLNGPLDIVIHNAAQLEATEFSKMSPRSMRQIIEINLLVPMLLTQYLLPFLADGSHIVSIGSMGGFQGSSKFKGMGVYAASKGGLAVFTECLAEELKDRNIKANCLALGATQTEMLEQAFPGYQAPIQSSEMAQFIAYFAVHGSRYFNGKVLPVSTSTP